MTVGSSGGQGNLRREIRRLTMPCSCCQISWAVKKASGAPGSAPMHSPTAVISCWNGAQPGH